MRRSTRLRVFARVFRLRLQNTEGLREWSQILGNQGLVWQSDFVCQIGDVCEDAFVDWLAVPIRIDCCTECRDFGLDIRGLHFFWKETVFFRTASVYRSFLK